MLLLTSKGSAGVAGAGFVTLAATLSSIGTVPVTGLVLLLGVDRFMNEARAVTNLIGNGIATIAIAKWDGALDQAMVQEVINEQNGTRAAHRHRRRTGGRSRSRITESKPNLATLNSSQQWRPAMNIVDIAEVTAPIASPIRNAYIDFSKMTCSLVAVVTDVERDGRRVVGYGFNSNGRYGQGGLIRERFAPRMLEAPPESLLNEAGDNLDPDKHLGHHDEEREAGRPWRAVRRGRHDRHGGLGCGGQDRRQAPVPAAGRAPRAARPIHASSSMRPAATTTPARASARCGTRCEATSIAATPS